MAAPETPVAIAQDVPADAAVKEVSAERTDFSGVVMEFFHTEFNGATIRKFAGSPIYADKESFAVFESRKLPIKWSSV